MFSYLNSFVVNCIFLCCEQRWLYRCLSFPQRGFVSLPGTEPATFHLQNECASTSQSHCDKYTHTKQRNQKGVKYFFTARSSCPEYRFLLCIFFSLLAVVFEPSFVNTTVFTDSGFWSVLEAAKWFPLYQLLQLLPQIIHISVDVWDVHAVPLQFLISYL